MANLEAHYSARDIEARILAAVRATGLNPGAIQASQPHIDSQRTINELLTARASAVLCKGPSARAGARPLVA
jgi:hypothetical protein